MPLIKIDRSKYLSAALNKLKEIPSIPPSEMFKRLEELGYRGQEKARRAVCLLAYRHIRRLKMIHLYGYSRNELPPHSNFLLMGPTGCGKTFLVELLFRDILKLPTVIIDITGFSETGYVGDDVKTILTRLLYAADFNPHWAAFGIVCIDEFDKLGISILGVSPDSIESHKSWADELKLEYPILSDPNSKVSKELGIFNQQTNKNNRATFILDPEGNIRYIELTEPSIGRNIREILLIVETLQTHKTCPARF